jgi:ABC-type branched-subunit amino acid transport system ATPase component
MSQHRLTLTNVTKTYSGRTVVDVHSMACGQYGIEGLMGPNGAGKTTLMGLITRKISADTGSILYRPHDASIELARMSFDAVARFGLVKTNQIIQDFDSLSIRDSLRLSLTPSYLESPWRVFGSNDLPDELEAEIAWYLEHFAFQNLRGSALSAGEKKLLDIVRCLVLKPTLLLMDEPTAGLPDDLTRQVMQLVKAKVANDGMRVLIVEHDLELIWEFCEYVHFLAEGQLLLQGTPDEVKNNALVAEKYIGTVDA